LEDYISLNDQLASVYKKHLPQNIFDTAAYKKKFALIDDQRKKDFVAFGGYENFGIPQSIPVFIAHRDFFTLYLVEEKGKIKVFTIGIGN
jgi:hypothetical protein